MAPWSACWPRTGTRRTSAASHSSSEVRRWPRPSIPPRAESDQGPPISTRESVIMPDQLSSLAPFPPPLALEEGYQRHAPSAEALRRALFRIGSLRNWAGASWPEFIAALLALGR